MTGPEFRKLRLHIGYTQGQLAKHLGRSIPIVHRYESGTIPIPDAIAYRVMLLAQVSHRVGMQYGALTIEAYAPPEEASPPYVIGRCVCGAVASYAVYDLVQERITSCGCQDRGRRRASRQALDKRQHRKRKEHSDG